MITTSPTQEYVRLSCRINSRVKQQVEQIASRLGQSITDFTEAALAEPRTRTPICERAPSF